MPTVLKKLIATDQASNAWRVRRAVPVAVLAHSDDEGGDVTHERPVRTALGGHAGFAHDSLTSAQHQNGLAMAKLVLEKFARVAEGRQLLSRALSIGDDDGLQDRRRVAKR
jgi:hypothetical protein